MDGMMKNKGFSLAEVMVTVLILAIGIIGLAGAYQASLGKVFAAQNNIQAAIIADSVLSELTNTPPSQWNLDDIKGKFHYNYDGIRVDASSSESYFTVEINEQDQGNYTSVTIGITWRGWIKDAQRSGIHAEETKYAYVLNADIAPLYDAVD